jgi:ribosomal protein L16 Arg81 hydroxylase
MDDRTYNLASLLHPISLDTFFSSHWEKSWLLIQREDPGYYEALLTNQNLEDIISSPDARYPALMLAKNGVYYPPHAYCEDIKMGHVTFSGVPNLKKLSAEYGKGATIGLTSLDRTWRPLGELCLRLEEQLDHATNTNAYITAGRTTGFPPHYDTHDILVLQITGRKLWQIYESTLKLPDVSQPCEPKSFSPGPLLAEIELNPGDLLYLPRGYGHAASTRESHSAHVTVGIHVYTWARLLKDRDPACVRREEFRKSLPPGFASRPELRAAIKEQLMRMSPEYFTDGNFNRAFDSIVGSVNQTRRRAPGRFRAQVLVIAPDSLLKTPPDHRYHFSRRVDALQNTSELTLDLDGNSYSFPPQLETLLNAMCSRGSFRLRELPGGHAREALLDLATYLQSIGFLTAIG